jgi:hypothetical protein
VISEFDCVKNIISVQIQKQTIGAMLSITSVGLLVTCDCKTTSAFEYDNYGSLPKIEVEYSGTSTTLYVANYLYDSVSNACGDGTGLTFCGTRSF